MRVQIKWQAVRPWLLLAAGLGLFILTSHISYDQGEGAGKRAVCEAVFATYGLNDRQVSDSILGPQNGRDLPLRLPQDCTSMVVKKAIDEANPPDPPDPPEP